MGPCLTRSFSKRFRLCACPEHLACGACRPIRIYDWGLADKGYTGPAHGELLDEFCRQGHRRLLNILPADDAWLVCPGGQRMRLLKVWGHVLQVRVRGAEPPPARDCFVLADGRRVLKR